MKGSLQKKSFERRKILCLKITQEKIPTKQTAKTAKAAKIPLPTKQPTKVRLANRTPHREKPKIATDKAKRKIPGAGASGIFL